MAKIVTIYPNGSMVETTPMSQEDARSLFNSLKNHSDNVYVLSNL